MHVHIFQGGDGLYGFTPRDDGGNLPGEYSPWRPLKSVKMVPDRTAPRIGANETEVLAAIKRQGYCITDVRIEFKETPPLSIRLDNTGPRWRTEHGTQAPCF